MNFLSSSASRRARNLFNKIIPNRRPPFLENKPQSIESFLSYEGVFETKRPVFLMGDGALGLMWDVTLIPHESLSESEIEKKIKNFCEIFQNIRDKDASFQLLFDSTPSTDFEKPSWFENPNTMARKIVASRLKDLERRAGPNESDLRAVSRKLLLVLRLEDSSNLGRNLSYKNLLTDNENETAKTFAGHFGRRLHEANLLGDSIEDSIKRAGESFTNVGEKELFNWCDVMFHDLSHLNSKNQKRVHPKIGESKFLKDFTEMRPYGIQVGRDSWEAMSWLEKSTTGYQAMMARLLTVDVPFRVCFTLRRVNEKSQLEKKYFFVKNSTDSQSERQRSEIKETLDRLEYGEELYASALHLFIRNENKSLDEIESGGEAKKVAERLESLTGIPFLVEKFSAPALFLSCLPLQYSRTLANFNAREKILLSRSIGFYLPIFRGFTGTPKLKSLYVQNRAGEVIGLSARASQTSPHLCFLGSSGAGKSFAYSGYLLGELALQRSKHFILDRRTSYEILARTLGEEVGFQISKPPESFPNIFRGKLDSDGDRLRTIVGVLTTAVSLTSPQDFVDAVKANLLSLAIEKTFKDLELDGRTAFDQRCGTLVASERVATFIPKLSDVIDNLVVVCEREGYEKHNSQWLKERFSPFYGSGPFAKLFDREELDTFEESTPGITLYDIDGVANDPILSTLTVLVIVAEILRQVKRPENRGIVGTITIEEAGVIASSSKELIAFIDLVWKIFRKLDYSCIGLTNDARDYKQKAGPKTMWRMSPNKMVLRMLNQDIDEALSSSETEPALFSNHITGKLISSLHKKDGAYSQGLWNCEDAQGTFTYTPTGYDYFLAASKPFEVETVKRLAKLFPSSATPFFEAVSLLAKNRPMGFRDENGKLYEPTDEELLAIKNLSVTLETVRN